MKIPVGATAAAAYRFTFTNYWRILGVGWAPLLLMNAVMLWLFYPLMAAANRGNAAHDPYLALSMFPRFLLFEGLTFLLLAAVAVGITRVALGLPLRWPFFYIGLDGDFWRLLLSWVMFFLILMAVVIGLSIVIGVAVAVSAVSGAGPHPDAAARGMSALRFVPIIIICVYALMFFLGVRLASLLPSIVLSEKRIGLGRNWMLSRGNFWRLLGLLILLLLPTLALVILQTIALVLLAGPDYNVLTSFQSRSGQMAWSGRALDLYRTYWYIYLPVALLLFPIFNGPLFGGSALAYRALAPAESESPPQETTG